MSLRTLCRYRESRLKEKVNLSNQLQNTLSSMFPEYKEVFSDVTTIESLKVLIKYPGLESLKMAELTELSGLEVGDNHHKLGDKKASQLKEAASSTVGSPHGSGEEFTLRSLAENLLRVKRDTARLKEKIEETYLDIRPNKLHTIDGIGPLLAAIITVEIGDINLFPTATKLNGYVGSYPKITQSGNKRIENPEMSNKGNKHLKSAVYQAVISAIGSNKIITDYYEKQLDRGKKRMVAIGSCMRKIVHLIYGILQSGEAFDPHYEEKNNRQSHENPKTNEQEEKPEPQAESPQPVRGHPVSPNQSISEEDKIVKTGSESIP